MWEVWLDHSANFAAGAADKLTRGATDRLREAMGINDEVDHDSMAYASGEVAGVAIEAGTMATGVGAVRTAGVRVVVGTALKGAAVSTGAGIGVELGVNAAVEAGFVSEGGGQVIKDVVTVARELAPVAGKVKAKFKTRTRPRVPGGGGGFKAKVKNSVTYELRPSKGGTGPNRWFRVGGPRRIARSKAAKQQYLKELYDSKKTPKYMNQWLKGGKVPPGHHVDHLKALSDGGADVPANMRLKPIDVHKTRHKYYHPWRD